MTNLLMRIETVEVFGFRINPITLPCYVNLLEELINNRKPAYIFYHNLHSLYLYFSDASIQRLYRDAVVIIDGMPIVWVLKLAGIPVQRQHRVTAVDYIWPLLERANAHGWRVFYLGSSHEVLTTGLAHIKQRLPDLAIRGHDGYYDDVPDSIDNQRIIAQINDFGADLCMVGMGTPRQERWVVENRPRIHAPAILICGALMEYLAGAVQTPPRWMGRFGLEWSYRLIENPCRFAHRYLVEPLILATMLLSNRLRKTDEALSSRTIDANARKDRIVPAKEAE